MSDVAAVGQALAGDTEAFGVLVERHSRNLYRLAWRMTGNRQDAEDVVQETFLRAFKQLKQFDARSSFGTWLYRIAANYSLDLVRGRQRREQHQHRSPDPDYDPMEAVPAPAPGPDRLAMSGQVEEQLALAMDELSAVERAAFVLRHHEGMCIEDIGRVLGVQPGAAKHSVFRAVQKLRRRLEPLLGGAR